MKRFLKGLIQVLFLATFGFLTTTATILSIEKSHEIPNQREINDLENINKTLAMSQQRAIQLSRKSSLRVTSISTELGGISTSSGTYIEFMDKYYVLTVAHGLIGGCEGTLILADELLYKCNKMIELNNLIDYGIMEVDKITERVPIHIPDQIPNGQQWKKDFSIMNRAYYTGFPNGIGPLTIEGKVVGYNENDFLYLQSYGWYGSSGAGIFSNSGKLIAYVLALTVGRTGHGHNVSEDIVIAVPLFKVNWKSIINYNKEEANEKEKRPSVQSELSDSADSDSGFGYSDQ